MSDLETDRIVTGDTFDVLPTLPEASVHAVVTDPPYGLNFMPDVTNGWDDFEPSEYQAWCERWAREVRRVLKPGGHLLAFSGNRTHHRLFTGVEDAGFEIRDTLTWHYGSGFPKATDVSKTIDKRAYKQRNDVQAFGNYLEERREDAGLSKAEIDRQLGTNTAYSWWEGRSDGIQLPDWDHYQELKDILDLDNRFDDLMRKESADRETVDTVGSEASASPESWFHGSAEESEHDITKPKRDISKKWDGWKTGLKPATEFVVMARKPFDGATVDCVLEHGTGALNIDETRIESDGSHKRPYQPSNEERDVYQEQDGFQPTNAEGRYPANVVFDETAAAALDREVGESKGSPESWSRGDTEEYGNDFHPREANEDFTGYGDSGGPSRYFYTSKASRSERTENGAIENDHPTVKPIDLMEWLIKLVTREGQVVLDPFTGSGTIPKAAKALNREFVGIEQQPRYADIARVRCGLTPDDPATVRSDDAQRGFEAYTDGGAD